MKKNLTQCEWQLSGHSPTSWLMGRTLEQAISSVPEVAPLPAAVPGSVQQALLAGGILPDWNKALNSLSCEWVEHRDWIYRVVLTESDLKGETRRLRCLGLDGYGSVFFNGIRVGEFKNGYVPHTFDLTSVSLREQNHLEIIFSDLPRFNGTPNISSKIRDLKARFNYAWDWMPRNVQIGIWDEVWLEVDESPRLEELLIQADFDLTSRTGSLFLKGAMAADETVNVQIGGVGASQFSGAQVTAGVVYGGLAVEPWNCNGQGAARLYPLTLELVTAAGKRLDRREERIGFKHVAWSPCDGAPAEADPWICELNGRKTFLVGVNWTPIRACYADVTEEDYRLRLEAYRQIGFNILRVWGGAFLEKEVFYRLCDEMGLMVWQEFPLSSSGPDNTPPTDEATVEVFGETARSYLIRRRHHASLLLWCGGNELQRAADGSPGCGRPWGLDHPMLQRFAEICAEEDPHTRYLPASASGPVFIASANDFGKGIHWDVHGPWRLPGATAEEAEHYWERDDALFRSETGAPGASPVAILQEYYPGCELLPVRKENPYWRRCYWWVDEEGFVARHNRLPATIEEYVAWSQSHQAEALVMALRHCRRRFPAIGGLIYWMGHDSFPCLANTSILDFHGQLKPAAEAIREELSA